MKKCFLMMLFAAGTYGALAQVDVQARTDMDNGTITLLSTGDYTAYSAPSNIQLYFTRDYPEVTTTVNWMPVGDWWRASYNDKGHYSHVFYTSSGDHYLVNLPVTTTWVPDDIVLAASNAHPGTVYDITTLKGMNGSTVYAVRYLEDGELKTEWINEQGTRIDSYYRTDDMNDHANMDHSKMDHSDMNHSNMNMKTDNIKEMKVKADEDGTKVKIETKDGKEIKKKTDHH